MMRNSLKNTITKILLTKKLSESFDIVEGVDGVDILHAMVHDENENLIKCIITADSMQYMRGCEALKILKDLKLKRKKQVAIALLKASNDYSEKTKKDYQTYAEVFGFADVIINKPSHQQTIKTFFEDFKIFDEKM